MWRREAERVRKDGAFGGLLERDTGTGARLLVFAVEYGLRVTALEPSPAMLSVVAVNRSQLVGATFL